MMDSVLKFYNDNKDCQNILPQLPENLSTLEKARWIMNNPEFGWVELDVDVDLEQWKIESHNIPQYLVHHRETESNGWSSCCLHGIRTDATQNWVEYVDEETDETYKWTELSSLVPNITEFWKSYPTEKFKRLRFMNLSPGGYIEQHSDAPGRGYLPNEPVDYDPLELGCPVNIAVVHPKDCHMIIEGKGVVPFKEGKMFLINIRRHHAVINFSNQNRLHMIGFCVFGNKKEEFAELLVKSYERNQV
jgi:hypothetical protein